MGASVSIATSEPMNSKTPLLDPNVGSGAIAGAMLEKASRQHLNNWASPVSKVPRQLGFVDEQTGVKGYDRRGKRCTVGGGSTCTFYL